MTQSRTTYLWYSVCSALCIIGTIVILVFWNATPFVDMVAAGNAGLYLLNTPDCDSEVFYKTLDALDRGNLQYHDFGWALLLSGISLALIGCFATRTGDAGLWTPNARWGYYTLVGLTAVSFAVLGYVEPSLLGHRGLLPYCADSIAIPIMGAMVATPILDIFLGLFVFALSFLFGALPVRLLIWDNNRPKRSLVVTTAAAPLTGFLVYFCWLSFSNESFAIVPLNIFLIYLLLSIRAAIIAPK